MLSRSRLLIAALFAATGAFAENGTPYTQATVTRVQNKVTYGSNSEKANRPAQSGDVVKAHSYLLTETDARAELKYADGSIVRIGQNTVFTFEADSRTLTLSKGALLFYIPKGQGGGTIRTRSLTASITGTIGKVADNMIAIFEGEVTLVPSGQKVGAGYFARRNADGTITVAAFDPATALGGTLWGFGGLISDTFDESKLLAGVPDTNIVRDIMHDLEMPDRMQNFPGAQELFGPKEKKAEKQEEQKAPTTPVPVRATPRPSGSPRPSTANQ